MLVWRSSLLVVDQRREPEGEMKPGALFAGVTSPTGDLPRFSEGIVTLLGISHAGYMANKAVDHSDSAKK
jgi:hypothetical protein